MSTLINETQVLVLVPSAFGPERTDALRGALGSDFRVMSLAELGRVELSSCVVTIAREHDLTLRHRDVLRGILPGNSNEEIAAELGISVGTVKTHVEEILKRTNTKNRQQLTGLAFRPVLPRR